MGNLCATPSITIIIHSRDFEEEVCCPTKHKRKPSLDFHVLPPVPEKEDAPINFMKVVEESY
jgi:hypothetical protein